METEAKYYTPSLEEFFVGFECEERYKDEFGQWMNYSPVTINRHEFVYLFQFPDKWLPKFRVKYLTAEDIESFGFKLIFSDIGIEYWKLGNFELRTDVDLGAYIDSDNLYSIFCNPYGKQYNCVFSGIIKNKSKLKQVLKMIGVQ